MEEGEGCVWKATEKGNRSTTYWDKCEHKANDRVKKKESKVNNYNGRPVVWNEPRNGGIEAPAKTLFACRWTNMSMLQAD